MRQPIQHPGSVKGSYRILQSLFLVPGSIRVTGCGHPLMQIASPPKQCASSIQQTVFIIIIFDSTNRRGKLHLFPEV
jgi:hypothetical protein